MRLAKVLQRSFLLLLVPSSFLLLLVRHLLLVAMHLFLVASYFLELFFVASWFGALILPQHCHTGTIERMTFQLMRTPMDSRVYFVFQSEIAKFSAHLGAKILWLQVTSTWSQL